MKKGLLLALGVSAGFGLFAQAPKVSGVRKVDLSNSKKTRIDGNNVNFYSSALATHRNGNPSVQTQGTKFSSSYNAFGLIVSETHCITANQALNAVLFTHRISRDWSADANTASGYIQYSWTPNFGTSWDSSYFADQFALGNKAYRYPAGGLINPAGNTTLGNAVTVCMGPYTDGTNWQGYYTNYQAMVNGATQNTQTLTNGQPGVYPNSFPRISMDSYDDSTAWGTGGRYGNDDGTTAAAQAYRGATLVKGKWNGTNVTWSYDSINPNFHQDSQGVNDCFTESFLNFSPDGQTGYLVFFGAEASQTAPSLRSFLPIVYKTTNGGTSWNVMPMNDFTTIPAIADLLIPASDNSLKPWFDQSEGADIMVDNNGQLHIVCCIESGSSNDDDSLGFAWTRTGLSGTAAMHYIYDVHTTANGWDGFLIDSLMTTTSTNNTIFTDGSNSGAAFATDARIQIAANAARDHMFVTWVDSDPMALAGENALPDLFGKGYDLNLGLGTVRKQFTTSQDFYFHYMSNVALTSGTTFKIGVTNSIDRDGSHDVATTFDHYWFDQCTFQANEFTVPIIIGVNEHAAAFGSFDTYPNPANELVNVNINLVKGANVNLTIVNQLGQVMVSENRTLASGSNNVQLNTSALASGVYFVTVSSENGKATSKLVIQ